LYSPRKTIRGSWSPDSRWIAYGLNSLSYIQSVNVYSLEQDKSFAVTDGLSDVSQPVVRQRAANISISSLPPMPALPPNWFR